MKKMTSLTTSDRIATDRVDLTPMQQSLRRWTAGLFVSSLVGSAFCIAGLAIGLLTIAEFVAPSTSLYAAGTILIGGAFILFGFAAHSLDKINVSDKAIRLDNCRKQGLREEE
ncbi:MAG: hypothetical protein ABIO91_04930 [Pyrinomonadaceae bacterium]